MTPPAARKRTPYVFLSYSRTDGPRARQIAHALQAGGIEIFIDTAGVREQISEDIERALGRMTHFVLLVSPRSLGSEWVTFERSAALTRRSQKKCSIIPVLLDLSVDGMPMLLQSFPAIHLSEGDVALERIVARVLDEDAPAPVVVRPPIWRAWLVRAAWLAVVAVAAVAIVPFVKWVFEDPTGHTTASPPDASMGGPEVPASGPDARPSLDGSAALSASKMGTDVHPDVPDAPRQEDTRPDVGPTANIKLKRVTCYVCSHGERVGAAWGRANRPSAVLRPAGADGTMADLQAKARARGKRCAEFVWFNNCPGWKYHL